MLSRLRKLRLAVLVALLLVTVAVSCIYFQSRYFGRNDFLVVGGELYRASQPNRLDLLNEIERFHFKSVINLRGENSHAKWYQQELAACRGEGVVHADVRFSAQQLPRPEEVDKLLADFDTLPKPILIHCKSGSDRTGLAGTIYLIDEKGMKVSEATSALSWHFGHFAIYPYFEMDEFFELFTEENPQKLSLRLWVKDDYPAIYQHELKETAWDEMAEPFESFLKIPYWKRW